MNRTLARIVAATIPGRERRRAFMESVSVAAPSFRTPSGERVFYPAYNPAVVPSAVSHPLYDAQGRRVHPVFLRDIHRAHAPGYRGGRLLWDRYNYGLKHHFYAHGAMLETMGHPDHRYGVLWETMGVVPGDYRLFDRHPGLEKDFDRVFTYSRRLLEKLTNAAFVPFCANVKLDFADSVRRGVDLMRGDLHETKTKGVSILSSGKSMCPLHALRIETARRLRRAGLADAFGTFDPGLGFVRAYDTLAPYRFSVVFENSVEDYCFTEKLTNCFACQTIPIYVGPPGVGEYFNVDGMIRVRPEEVGRLEDILRRATPEFYAERLPAVLDNYRRALAYRDVPEAMFDRYLAQDFGEAGRGDAPNMV